jgi:hypothetical protein
VILDGVLADNELLGDVAIGCAPRQQAHNIHLAWRQVNLRPGLASLRRGQSRELVEDAAGQRR